MNTIVYATHKVTPELWADFGHTAQVPPINPSIDPRADPSAPPLIPYVLVYSLSHPDDHYTTRTNTIPKPIESEFSPNDYATLLSSLPTAVSKSPRNLYRSTFLVLDEQSTHDRTAVVMTRDVEWVDEEGNVDEEGGDLEGNRKRILWKKRRARFEDVWDHVVLLDAKPGLVLDEEVLGKWEVERMYFEGEEEKPR